MFQFLILTAIFTLMHCTSDQWAYNVLYYQPRNLTCDVSDDRATNDSVHGSPTKAGQSILWLLPSGQILKPGDDHERVDIAPDGHWLHVKRVNDVDFGMYNCLVFTNGVLTQNFRKGINIDGAYWGNLIEKYGPNAVVGAVAAAISFAAAAILCFCYDRHQGRGQRCFEDYEDMILDKVGSQNAGYEMEETKVPEKNGIELPPTITKL